MFSFNFGALIDENIDCQLYTDFESHEFEDFAPIRHGKNGANIDIRQEVVAEINQTMKEKDRRPKAFDKRSGLKVLIDTGASISCWPKNRVKSAVWDPGKNLIVVNGSQIKTFGTQCIDIQLDHSVFKHEVVIASVDSPVLGFDFMVQHKVDLVWSRDGQCSLKVGNKKIRLSITHCDVSLLNLARIDQSSDDFQKWSQAQNVANKEAPTPIPTAYQSLLNKYPNIDKPCFVGEPKHGVVHEIQTFGSPCRAKVRPLLPGSSKAIIGEKNWKEMERVGIVARVNPKDPITWTSALHLAPKSNGDWRSCGDFRPLNNQTVLDTYPLPALKNFTHKLKGAQIFSKCDLVSAFWQVPLSREAQKKTCTLTPWGAFEFRRLPMGLRNSAQSFQRLLDTILHDIDNIYVYLDDILIWSKNEKEHKQTLDKLFERLSENGLALSLGKCVFGVSSIQFLGYQVTTEGIQPLPRKVDAIVKFPTPTKPRALLGYLGALNYYRRCLPSVDGQLPAQVLQPLYLAATSKTPKVKFTETWKTMGLQKNFEQSKKMLILAANLQHPDPLAPLALTTDASKFAIGGVLEHFVGGYWRPLGYFSKHLPPSKQVWSTFRREMVAISQSVRHFHDEIAGRHLVVWTDHQPIVHAFKSPNSQNHDAISQNHLNEIAQWTSDVRFVAGKANCVADVLSRPSHVPMGTAYEPPDGDDDDGETPGGENEKQPIPPAIAAITRADARRRNIDVTAPSTDADTPVADETSAESEEVSADHNFFQDASTDAGESFADNIDTPENFETVDVKAIMSAQEQCPETKEHAKGHHPDSINMKLVEFAPSVKVWCDLSTGLSRPLVPQKIRDHIIALFHDMSHPGQKATFEKVSKRYYWQGMRSDISAYVSSCHICQQVKQGKTIKPPMKPIPVPPQRFSQLMVDVVGPLEESEGMKYILTVLCRTSRWVEAIPMPEATAKNCANALIRHWIPTFGLPTSAISDNGNTFVSKIWKEIHEKLGVIVSYTPNYHPASLGHLERQHREIKVGLRAALLKMSQEHSSRWMEALPWIILNRHTVHQPDLNASAAEMVMGQCPKIPGDICPSPDGEMPTVECLLEKLRRNAAAPPVQTSFHGSQPVFWPSSAAKATHVYVKVGKPTPLGPTFKGPYPITKRLGTSCLEIRVGSFKNGQHRLETVHWNNCKPGVLRPGTEDAQRPTLGRKPN